MPSFERSGVAVCSRCGKTWEPDEEGFNMLAWTCASKESCVAHLKHFSEMLTFTAPVLIGESWHERIAEAPGGDESGYDSRVDTYEHILKVQKYVNRAISGLLRRAHQHDQSKLYSPEVEMFDKFTPLLAELEYGSEEYKAATTAMGSALEHHYLVNSHHPEHHRDGIAGMSLLDLIEMLCDWKAASERHRKRPAMPAAPGRSEAPQYDSNIERSIGLNQERWGYSDEVKAILTNTARELGLIESPRARADREDFGIVSR